MRRPRHCWIGIAAALAAMVSATPLLAQGGDEVQSKNANARAPFWGRLIEPAVPSRQGDIIERRNRAYPSQVRRPDGTLYPTDQYLQGQTNHPSVASPNH